MAYVERRKVEESLVVYLSNFVGLGVKKLLPKIDEAAGKAGAPEFERPSTWIKWIGALGPLLGYLFGAVPEEYKTPALVFGSYMATVLAEEKAPFSAGLGGLGAIPVPAPARVVPTASVREAPATPARATSPPRGGGKIY